ncbi:hypothetical protein INR49_008726 [Caranx melampygus]|nr:hypothetical protein INR49_008726 [Caranx melampygus]
MVIDELIGTDATLYRLSSQMLCSMEPLAKAKTYAEHIPINISQLWMQENKQPIVEHSAMSGDL